MPLNLPPPYLATLQGEYLEMENGRCVIRYLPREDLENPFGVIQGGVTTAMLDGAMGPAIFSLGTGRPFATVQLDTNYLRPVRSKAPVLAVAEVLHQGSVQIVVDARLLREADEVLLATARAVNVYTG